MEIKKIELRNINCAHVKKIERTFEEYGISYLRKNYVKNSDLLGELTVIFEIAGDIKTSILRIIESTMRNIVIELVAHQHIKINEIQVKKTSDIRLDSA